MTSEDVRIESGALRSFAEKVIASAGVPADRAYTTADILVGADLRGISSHGVAGGTGLSELIDRIGEGAILPDTLPVIEQKKDWAIATVDAKGGVGPPAAMEAAHLAGDLAERFGVGRVHVRDANHFGAACLYVEALAARGFAARATCTSGAWMIPHGGNQIRFGTNPIAWGVPASDFPIVIDIATTQRAVSTAVRAARAGDPIPSDYFLDAEGKPLEGIVSLETIFQGSTLPLGGKQYGYKGSGLAMLVDLDSVIGGGSTGRIPTMRETPFSRVSQTFEAWRLDFLFPLEEAQEKIETAVADIRKHGGSEMLLPGEREARRKKEAEEKGIPYERSQWEAILKIASKTKIAAPPLLSL